MLVPPGFAQQQNSSPHLDKPDVLLPCAQRLHDAVDAVARQTEYDVHVPGGQALEQNICGSLAM